MSLKRNCKFLPVEIASLQAVAAHLDISRNQLIRRCITDTEFRAKAQQLITESICELGGFSATEPTKRTAISLRLSTAELQKLRALRQRGNTITETLRAVLCFRHISTWYQNAARASARPHQRLVTDEIVEHYFKIIKISAQIYQK